MIRHDPSDRRHRDPAGAAEQGSPVRLAAEASPEVGKVTLCYIYNDAEIFYKEMKKAPPLEGAARFEIELTLEPGLYFYWFKAEDKSGEVNWQYKNRAASQPDDSLPKWQITVYKKGFRTPEFIKGGVMYHIFVDRFARSGKVEPRPGFYMHKDPGEPMFFLPDADGEVRNEDVYGGNLRGIIDKLGYLETLNVSILYLSPIFEANSNHKYNTGDYMKIDGMFGSDADFDELIAKAGARGMMVILDGVFNHTGDDSVYFNKYGNYDSLGAYQSEASPYRGWYTFDSSKYGYVSWWGVPWLPAIRKDQPLFRAFVCGPDGVIAKWLKRGVAGFRLDVADELSDKMLRAINRVSKDNSPENIVIGEVWEDASTKVAYGARRHYLEGDQLDSVMNYPLKDGIIDYLRTGDARAVSSVMEMIAGSYPKQAADCLMNVLGTHDTMRILTVLGMEGPYIEDKGAQSKFVLSPGEYARGARLLKLAAVMQFTLPGVPCIYYGDEAGMQGYGDPFNRGCFPWGREDAELYAFYRKLARVRAENEVYARGEYRLISDEGGVYCFSRSDPGGREVYTCVNMARSEYPLAGAHKSLLTGESVTSVRPGESEIFVKCLQ